MSGSMVGSRARLMDDGPMAGLMAGPMAGLMVELMTGPSASPMFEPWERLRVGSKAGRWAELIAGPPKVKGDEKLWQNGSPG